MLVEDEYLVNDLTKQILERAGYRVLSALNGKEALSLFRKEMDRISLVILDLIMPEMGGRECLEELRKLDPSVKVLITSGHLVLETEREDIGSAAKGFVNKPYTMKQILTAVREVLDSD